MTGAVVNIDVEIVARTERAVLAHTGNKEEAAWLPLAQIEVNATGFEGIHTITMPEWLATKEGLV
jgi:hypothetical protein